MAGRSADELRAQAAHARQLAKEMFNRDAQADLLRIADALDAEADEVQQAEAPTIVPPQPNTT